LLKPTQNWAFHCRCHSYSLARSSRSALFLETAVADLPLDAAGGVVDNYDDDDQSDGVEGDDENVADHVLLRVVMYEKAGGNVIDGGDRRLVMGSAIAMLPTGAISCVYI